VARGAEEKKVKRRTSLPFFEIVLRFSGLILDNIFMVLLSSSCRETAKNAIKKDRRGKTTDGRTFFYLLFGQKVFDLDFPQKFFVVF
jgi:hypothetical protein